MIDDGSFNGLRKYIRSSSEDADTIEVRTEQDVTAFLERNKRAQIESMNTRMGDGIQHVATIPGHIIYEWLTKFGINFYNPNHQAGVDRLLNSSDYRWLKVKNIII